MSDLGIDQIEFRWRENYDLTWIATSPLDPQARERWARLLAPYVRTPDAPGHRVPPDQRIYLRPSPQDAMYILRGNRQDAVRVAHTGDSRHGLVARALVGPADLLTPELMLRLSITPPKTFLQQAPGTVAPDSPLDRLDAVVLNGAAMATAELTGKARESRWLSKLLTARLRDPSRPITVLVPDDADLNVYTGPIVALLWGLLHTAGPLLRGLPMDTGNLHDEHQLTTFSTFEPTPHEGRDLPLPHMVFQPGNRATHRGRQAVYLGSEDGGGREDDPYASFASGLVRAFAELGATLANHMPDALPTLDLDDRLRLVTTVRDLRQYWGRSQPARQSVRPAADPILSPSHALGQPPQTTPAPPAVAPPPTVGDCALRHVGQHRTPSQAPPLPVTQPPRSRAPIPDGPRQPLQLWQWYDLLRNARDTQQFAAVAELIGSKARIGESLPHELSFDTLRDICTSGWHVPRITEAFGDRGTDRLVLLLLPVLRGLLQQPAHLAEATEWIDAPPLARQALARARMYFDDEAGKAFDGLLSALLEKPYSPVACMEQPSGQEWQQAALSTPAAPPVSEPSGKVLGLPLHRLPEPVVAAGLWVALVSTLAAVIALVLVVFG